MNKLNLLDLFSGVGGFSLGLERSGAFQTVAFCEIEPYCQQVLKKHWPKVPIYDDVTTLSAAQLKRDGIHIDAICGGFPCQDVSEAGKGKGLAGERSGLWFEYARLIGEIRPRYVLIENVSELLVRGIDEVLSSLASFGYDAVWNSIQAYDVGAPHIRDRVWIVAFIPDTDGVRFGQCWFSNCKKVIEEKRNLYPWEYKSRPPGMADGVPYRVDRNRAMGNAVVPQIPELIGGVIKDYEENYKTLLDT